jgi:DNA replication protein DnaC
MAKVQRDQQQRDEYLLTPEGQAEQERLVQEAEARAAAERTKIWLEAAATLGIPTRYRDARLVDINPEQFPATDWTAAQAAINRVRKYLEIDFPHGRALGLAGPPGVGKTYAACAALHWVFERMGTRGRQFWPVSVLRASLMNLERRNEVFESIRTVPFLVLDDIGMEFSKGGDFFEVAMDAVLVEREANMLATLFTTNLDPDALAVRLGPRAMDRIRGEWGAIAQIVGPSLRRKL